MADDNEPQMRRSSFHTGGQFEHGGVGHRNGQGPDDVEVVDAREPEQPAARGGGRQPANLTNGNIASYFGRSSEGQGNTTEPAAEMVGAAGHMRPKKQKHKHMVEYKGNMVEVTRGESLCENEKWIVILDISASGNKLYGCRICGHEWRASGDGRVWPHYLRVSNLGVKACTRSPSEEMRDTMERARELHDKGKRTTGKGASSAGTPSINMPGIISSREKLTSDVDQALVEWSVLNGIPASAIEVRSESFKKVLRTLFLAGPSYLPPQQAILMCMEDRGVACRAGGLFLANRAACM